MEVHEKTCQNQLRKLAQGLKYMHNHGFAHLDFKPDNVLCDKSGYDVWIMDFAQTAKLNKDKECRNLATGTKIYNSPEVCTLLFLFALTEQATKHFSFLQRHSNDSKFVINREKADVFALGMTLFTITTGINAKVLYQHCNGCHYTDENQGDVRNFRAERINTPIPKIVGYKNDKQKRGNKIQCWFKDYSIQRNWEDRFFPKLPKSDQFWSKQFFFC